jgi:hypothetical protein
MLDSLVLFTAAGGLDMALFLAEIAFCFPEIAFISGVVLPTAAGAWLAVNLRGRGRPLCLEGCLEDRFIVDSTQKTGAHRLIEGVFDGREVARSRHLAYAGCQLMWRFPRLPLDLAPESKTLSHYKSFGVVVLRHEALDGFHGKLVSRSWFSQL